MFQHGAHGRLPVRLFDRSPRRETRPRSGPQHAMQFAQGDIHVGEEHHPETAGRHIEALIGKRQRVSVTLLEADVAELAVFGTLAGQLQ